MGNVSCKTQLSVYTSAERKERREEEKQFLQENIGYATHKSPSFSFGKTKSNMPTFSNVFFLQNFHPLKKQ